MRPPQNAGESALAQPSGSGDGRGFNEAPAERGGKSSFKANGGDLGYWLQ